MKKLSRVPVLNRDIYCSPACGFGCKKAKHDEAVKIASELAYKLGDGWEAEVWENLGWHWCVKKGVCQIYPGYSSGYTIYLNVQPQIVLFGECAEDLLGLALHEARTQIVRTEHELAEVIS